MSFQFKTRAQQRLEWLLDQSRERRLTNEEWADVSRSEHAIYCRQRRKAAA